MQSQGSSTHNEMWCSREELEQQLRSNSSSMQLPLPPTQLGGSAAAQDTCWAAVSVAQQAGPPTPKPPDHQEQQQQPGHDQPLHQQHGQQQHHQQHGQVIRSQHMALRPQHASTEDSYVPLTAPREASMRLQDTVHLRRQALVRQASTSTNLCLKHTNLLPETTPTQHKQETLHQQLQNQHQPPQRTYSASCPRQQSCFELKPELRHAASSPASQLLQPLVATTRSDAGIGAGAPHNLQSNKQRLSVRTSTQGGNARHREQPQQQQPAAHKSPRQGQQRAHSPQRWQPPWRQQEPDMRTSKARPWCPPLYTAAEVAEAAAAAGGAAQHDTSRAQHSSSAGLPAEAQDADGKHLAAWLDGYYEAQTSFLLEAYMDLRHGRPRTPQSRPRTAQSSCTSPSSPLQLQHAPGGSPAHSAHHQHHPDAAADNDHQQQPENAVGGWHEGQPVADPLVPAREPYAEPRPTPLTAFYAALDRELHPEATAAAATATEYQQAYRRLVAAVRQEEAGKADSLQDCWMAEADNSEPRSASMTSTTSSHGNNIASNRRHNQDQGSVVVTGYSRTLVPGVAQAPASCAGVKSSKWATPLLQTGPVVHHDPACVTTQVFPYDTWVVDREATWAEALRGCGGTDLQHMQRIRAVYLQGLSNMAPAEGLQGLPPGLRGVPYQQRPFRGLPVGGVTSTHDASDMPATGAGEVGVDVAACGNNNNGSSNSMCCGTAACGLQQQPWACQEEQEEETGQQLSVRAAFAQLQEAHSRLVQQLQQLNMRTRKGGKMNANQTAHAPLSCTATGPEPAAGGSNTAPTAAATARSAAAAAAAARSATVLREQQAAIQMMEYTASINGRSGWQLPVGVLGRVWWGLQVLLGLGGYSQHNTRPGRRGGRQLWFDQQDGQLLQSSGLSVGGRASRAQSRQQ